ncbi:MULTISPECIES: 2-hydroxychromene-2-carboxylate isomerase [Achromobacter]|uniref:2-hydroxychromene-2-carboxylate isomerase n=1 Tax=Alcaligenes xylosoxydans xylosoxydans TaxID=85698 RepID=A0A424WFY6_ALCXX|nr:MULTISPECIES: 2-hydroxychromene-2-carboxylate isomerase [Achromobacter]MBC9905743.1 2-hydroxychromene-2-carboxylate isomerase [Achromobacter xylosoxidans]MBD0869372.1 2-hydroxychromene-2-carboxylate isomerase [Achromobacter xylosoxidans]MDH1304498.1 2-hydroxychromene-2-carboxylate isomerase [Achromobacter sp. GD03932]QNP86255.1 2-hydroxychromene-2-carboxylate isomerase [Achromobacter xylosoxidans]RPJ92165.1 2-hydroxychromene-2-carboxylate isomerase [Achromobacter xylosoxidans]
MTAPLPDTPRIEMWFDFASPYSYLAIERVDALAQEAGVRVDLRPFLLGPIFQAQGWNDTPFRLFPGKGAYMMRDIARLAEKYGLVYNRPRLFPRMSVLPARIALLGQDEPWGRDFCVAVFRANFQHDLDIQSEDVVHGLLTDLGLDAAALIARGKSEAAKEALRRQVDRARNLGLFGAPTFFVDGEMFWGNDRLEDALEWTRRAAPASAWSTSAART